MKESREVENFGVKSHAFQSGDLKMVKVRRGKRGRQSRSLVFRISRTSKPISDDSGIKCSSTDEETTSTAEEQIQPPLYELKIRIPKRAIQDGAEKREAETVESASRENSDLHNDKFNMATHGDVPDSRMDIADVGTSSVDDLNLNEVNLRSTRSILCPNTLIDYSKKTPARVDKSNELRRSSRRIVLRVQKDCQPSLSVKEPSTEACNFSFNSSSNSGQPVSVGEKKKRGRKPKVRNVECKKRKYVRRGKPAKPQFPKQLSFVKPVISDEGNNEKLLLVAPPKNSVWTLVPKELFESEFFKSQLLKVRVPNSSDECAPKKRNLGPVAFSSPFLPHAPISETSTPKQVRIPMLNVNNTPATREKTVEEKDPKRPTVIYFKTEKKKFDCPRDQKIEFRNPQLLQLNKAQTDMSYLFNKYHTMEDIILKNYYDLAGGNLNEAEGMLSNFLSNTPDMSVVDKTSVICDSQTNLSNCSDFDLCSPESSRPSADWLLPSSEPILDNVDTLSRKLIVQSLEILFHEEAVLA